jgi:cysteinylglycine-S-conjugate dipeptidase
MVAVEAYGGPMASLGPGRSIPLCDVFNQTYPDAEFIVMGVEERLALIHAPNLSVQATELFSMALSAARFLHRHADARA